MIKTFEYNGIEYPEYEKEGFASQFIIPFARKVCEGVGYDIGYGRKEWALPGSIPIENYVDGHNAFHLPEGQVDYIFSSHCLEHIPDWVMCLDYWTSKLFIGGVLFLYLPDYSQEYWHPWNNLKHFHVFTPLILCEFMEDRGYVKIFSSERDLNDSFAVMGERGEGLPR
jgi:hypothetical protein